ncbi:hypothetical protein DFH09DRAFT_1359131 [Mycena vulgaris]|nr:hypothetical protein DFH09DRAFT_1359131 [Mycena vulgaris]
MVEAREMLRAFRHVRRLHFAAPVGDGSESPEDLEEVDLASEFVELLSKLPLEQLILNVWVRAYLLHSDENDPEEIGRAAVQELADTCEALESVQLRYMWEAMRCEDEPVIVECSIGKDSTLEVVEPRTLEGTILEFLDWR